VAASLILVVLLAGTPEIDCSKVRWFVSTYGRSEALRIARKWYSDDQIKAAEAKCLKR